MNIPILSIIICFRNEEKHLEKLFNSLKSQSFQKFELFLIDDFSDDGSVQLVQNFISSVSFPTTFLQLRYYLGEHFHNLSNKKRAITIAIQKCNAPIVLLTDADCFMGSFWAETMLSNYIETKADLCFGPVAFTAGKNLFTCFQEIDLMAMMASTKLSLNKNIPILGNAANMMFSKEKFEQLNGYSDNINYASGDDIFLLQQFHKAKSKIHFIAKEKSIVYTYPESTVEGFVQQRIRWAGKSQNYKVHKVKAVLVGIYLLNVMFMLLFVLSLFQLLPFGVFLFLFSLKTFADCLILFPELDFFKRKKLLWGIPLFECMHILYVVCIGFLSLKQSYVWKGRLVKQ